MCVHKCKCLCVGGGGWGDWGEGVEKVVGEGGGGVREGELGRGEVGCKGRERVGGGKGGEVGEKEGRWGRRRGGGGEGGNYKVGGGRGGMEGGGREMGGEGGGMGLRESSGKEICWYWFVSIQSYMNITCNVC